MYNSVAPTAVAGPSRGSSQPQNQQRGGLTIDVSGANRGRHQQIDPAQQQARDYQTSQAEAHSILEDESPVSSGDEVAESLQVRNGNGNGGNGLDGGESDEHDRDGGGEEDQDDSGSFSDSLSSSPSIPDEDIDFALVYALHTFLATVDGQASVVKGDKLLLLDDSNSYWWLVRVLKTQAVGYIPAENIETPFERLARLNKHRNVDLTTVTQEDVITGPNSTIAQSRFRGRIPPSAQPHPHESQHPSAKGVLASPSHKDHPRNISPTSDRPERSASSKAKTVIFTAPTYYEHSANGETDDEEYDDEMEDGEHMSGEQVFDDDDGDESEFSDDGLTEDNGDEQMEDVTAQQGQVAGRRAEMHTGMHHVQASDEGHDGGDEDDPNSPRWEEDQQNARARAEAEARWRQEQQLLQQQQLQLQRSISPLSPQEHQPYDRQRQQQEEQLRQQQMQQQQQLEEYQTRQQYEIQQHESDLRKQQQSLLVQQKGEDAMVLQQQQRAASAGAPYPSSQVSNGELQRRGSDPNRRPSESSSTTSFPDDFDPDAPTKKLTATPPIVRDPTFDMNNPLGQRSSSPLRVRGVEVVDPKDPRYQRLISERKVSDQPVSPDRRPSAEAYATGPASSVPLEADLSLNSFETNSSLGNGPASEDSHRGGVSPTNSSAVNGKKLKKASRESMETVSDGGEKKRKSGGILSGLFRKKDKKKKDDGREGDALRTSEDSLGRTTSSSPTATISPRPSTERAGEPAPNNPTSTAASRRESQTGESMFSTDAALRQQQVEAKQAMYHQYGVQRAPGDVTNTMTPRNASMQQQTLSPSSNNSPNPLQPPQRMRPGSLIGSPSIPGLDVPLLSVLRVFAGDNVESEATFKTVLLNSSTSSSDLVKQAMQRFRLIGSEEAEEYYLTVKEIGGEERALQDEQKPLVIFESLSESAGRSGFTVPSVKRSSIGSISSISSSLSLNPAITRLGMNDFSDDSAVKFYLNRRLPDEPSMNSNQSDTESVLTATGLTPSTSMSSTGEAPASATQSFRFALRLLIHPDDLPENVAFDPQSNAIVPKSILLERQQRSGGVVDFDPTASQAREKIIFVPKNANVSEVIEAALDRFGIVDGVVEGGDEVEDRVSRRRSVTRVKYGLCVVRDQKEIALHPSGKVLDAYATPPNFKSYDRTSKEFRRRSVDATLILGSPQDLQDSDPVFVIRRQAQRGLGINSRPSSLNSPRLNNPIAEENEERFEQPPQGTKRRSLEARGPPALAPPLLRADTALSTASGDTGYATASEDRTEEIVSRAASPQATRQEIIAAQRAVTRANQRAMLSAQKNSEQGVDIVLPDRGTIRSSRILNTDRVRYSFIDENGTVDISELVESEWAGQRSHSSQSQETLATTTDADSFHSLESPTSTASFSTVTSRGRRSMEDDEDDDRQAITRLADARVPIDAQREAARSPTSPNTPTSSARKSDVLQDAITRPDTLHTESLQDRLDRVLAKVRDGKAMGRNSPNMRHRGTTGSGRSSPSVAPTNGRVSPADRRPPSGSGSQGRRSPFANGGRDSPSIDQLMGSSGRSPLSAVHGKQPSITSVSSAGTDQPSTPITPGSNANSSFTPVSSVNSNHRTPVAYHSAFGLETLMALVDGQAQRPSARPRRDPGLDGLFGRPVELQQPETRELFSSHAKTLDDLDSKLDVLMARLIQA